jgi:hypothetical protein
MTREAGTAQGSCKNEEQRLRLNCGIFVCTVLKLTPDGTGWPFVRPVGRDAESRNGHE